MTERSARHAEQSVRGTPIGATSTTAGAEPAYPASFIDAAPAGALRPVEQSRVTDLLSPAMLRQIRLDLTSRCNLRCVYCAVSQKAYRGIDMAAPEIERAVQSILALAPFHDFEPIDMNGHGETTIVEGWTEVCKRLLAAGVPLRLTTNLAKEFSADELDVLSRMNSIAISIDTSDRVLLRRLRRKVDVRQIIANVALVRTVASRNFMKPPTFAFLCGLYDKNSLVIEDLAHLAISLGVADVGFWSLTPYPYENTDVADGDKALPLDDLPDAELVPRLQAIGRALQTLRRAGVRFHVQADFVEVLKLRRGLSVE